MIPGYIALDAEIMKGMPGNYRGDRHGRARPCGRVLGLRRPPRPLPRNTRAAVRLIFKYQVRAFNTGGDLEARDGMALAAFYAGAAFTKTSVGYVHGIAHQLGGSAAHPR